MNLTYESLFIGSEDNPRDALEAHRVLANKYEIGRVLGSGGCAFTYLAWDRVYRRPVVVKELVVRDLVQRNRQSELVIVKTTKNNADILRRWKIIEEKFQQESQILSQLPPSTYRVGLIDRFSELGTQYYVTHYQPGQVLTEWCDENQLNIDELWKLLTPLWVEIALLHKSEILHRDIKPDNIIIAERHGEFYPVLIDFGIARSEYTKHTRKITSIAGTDGYAPPEQMNELNAEQGAWTDIYGIAATFIRCLTHEEPSAILLENYELAKRNLQKINVNAHVMEKILSGIQYKPESRPQNVMDWVDAVEKALKPVVHSAPKTRLVTSEYDQSAETISSLELFLQRQRELTLNVEKKNLSRQLEELQKKNTELQEVLMRRENEFNEARNFLNQNSSDREINLEIEKNKLIEQNKNLQQKLFSLEQIQQQTQRRLDEVLQLQQDTDRHFQQLLQEKSHQLSIQFSQEKQVLLKTIEDLKNQINRQYIAAPPLPMPVSRTVNMVPKWGQIWDSILRRLQFK